MIRVICAKDYDEMSALAADFIAAQIILNPDSILGLATGSTPVGTYQELIRRYRAQRLDFSGVRTVNLDEYLGLKPEDSHSYRYFMNEVLFDHINIDPSNTYLPDGMAKDLQAMCRPYDERIRSLGGIDLQLLGIGHNGHIGFNEPGEAFEVPTHVISLSPRTVEANARWFTRMEDVPGQAVTMGIGGIMHARRILMIANGKGKARALAAALHGPVTPGMPASILQLHPDVTVIADEQALSDD